MAFVIVCVLLLNFPLVEVVTELNITPIWMSNTLPTSMEIFANVAFLKRVGTAIIQPFPPFL